MMATRSFESATDEVAWVLSARSNVFEVLNGERDNMLNRRDYDGFAVLKSSYRAANDLRMMMSGCEAGGPLLVM